MNFYDVLGVDRDADRSEIRGAYRDLARRYHPDVNEHPDASDQFKVLTTAREVLTDEEERSAYDRLGHADYVSVRVDGDLPDPEMTPRPEDGGGGAAASTPRGGSSSPSTGGGGSASAGSTTRGTTSAGSSSGSAGSTSGGSTTRSGSEASSERSSGPSGSAGGATRSGRTAGGSSASGASAPSGSTVGGGETSRSADDRGTSSYSTPPTPGSAGSQTGARGPERISNTRSRRAARRMGSLRETVRAHFAASNRWLAVLGTAAVYFGGLAGYLRANATGVDAFRRDLTSSEPQRVARALGGSTYDAPGLFAYAVGAGDPAASVSPVGVVAVLGALALPVVLGAAVAGLRRRTTWRPSWMHVLGALGPVASMLLASGTGEGGVVPVGTVPLIVHLLLLVGFPGVVVASFLLNRLVVVVPLRRREDLGLP